MSAEIWNTQEGAEAVATAYERLYRRIVHPASKWAHELHQRRYDAFVREVGLRPEHTVLDVGCNKGDHFGGLNQGRNHVTGLDILPCAPYPQWYKRFVQGSARDMPFADGEFDVVFSNSMIEHVGDWDAQVRVAREIVRVGRHIWAQTPNRHFPVEVHYGVPLAQWLTNWDKRDGIRLISPGEMRRLFPGCRIVYERIGGLAKSIIAVR